MSCRIHLRLFAIFMSTCGLQHFWQPIATGRRQSVSRNGQEIPATLSVSKYGSDLINLITPFKNWKKCTVIPKNKFKPSRYYSSSLFTFVIQVIGVCLVRSDKMSRIFMYVHTYVKTQIGASELISLLVPARRDPTQQKIWLLLPIRLYMLVQSCLPTKKEYRLSSDQIVWC